MSRNVLPGIVLAGLMAGAGLSGCVSASGKSYPPTLGQQLIELQTAHNRGAINDEEYAQAKADLLATAPMHARR